MKLRAVARHFVRRMLDLNGNPLSENTNGLFGRYASWREALAATDGYGYSHDTIVEKTKEALLKVKNGEAVYERDSVIFDHIEYSWPVLSGLMWVAARSNGRLEVLDYGGSLGSTYYQNRAFLARISKLTWSIVEQQKHVEIGREFFEDGTLRFFKNVDECLSQTTPNVILFASVLQYLEDPHQVLKSSMKLPADCIILDRTPFWNGTKDILSVQLVPDEIYRARYPSWIFSESHFRTQATDEWSIVAEFDNPDRLPGPVEFSYKGMILTRRNDDLSGRSN